MGASMVLCKIANKDIYKNLACLFVLTGITNWQYLAYLTIDTEGNYNTEN